MSLGEVTADTKISSANLISGSNALNVLTSSESNAIFADCV
jgi:hypothetical protein